MLVKSFALVWVLVIGLALAGCGSSNPPASSGSSGSGSTRAITVEGTEFKFTPADQTFKAGEKVRVTLQNKGAVVHTWILQDSAGKEIVKLKADVGKSDSKEFTVPTTPGTYQIVCDEAGHKESGMVGKATVQ
jgi:plastocyanin